jgi:hypothetical protein
VSWYSFLYIKTLSFSSVWKQNGIKSAPSIETTLFLDPQLSDSGHCTQNHWSEHSFWTPAGYGVLALSRCSTHPAVRVKAATCIVAYDEGCGCPGQIFS